MANNLSDNSLCLQYADDSTVYRNWNDINCFFQELQNDINGLVTGLQTETHPY